MNDALYIGAIKKTYVEEASKKKLLLVEEISFDSEASKQMMADLSGILTEKVDETVSSVKQVMGDDDSDDLNGIGKGMGEMFESLMGLFQVQGLQTYKVQMPKKATWPTEVNSDTEMLLQMMGQSTDLNISVKLVVE